MKAFMIYGANGYTGRLLAAAAAKRGLRPVLAGRKAQDVEELAKSLGLDARIFPLDDPAKLRAGLDGMWAVLHCAGPFSRTSLPMLRGCMAAKAHYLDITGEIGVFESLFHRQREVKDAGIVAIPGVGFDVVPTDCLAARLAEALPRASHLALAFAMEKGGLSPGTSKTMVEGLGEGGAVRRDGRIVGVAPAYKTREIPFDHRTLNAVTIPWGDVSTAFHSTAIPNIEVYMAAPKDAIRAMKLMGHLQWLFKKEPVQDLLKALIGKYVKGPSEGERASGRVHLWGEATTAGGERVSMTMVCPEGYDFTVASALAALDALDEANLAPGCYTPSRAFGSGFVNRIPGVVGPA